MLKESRHLLIILGDLAEFLLDESLKNLLQFLLHSPDGWWNKMPKLVVKVGCLVQLFCHACEVHEILWIRFWQLVSRDCTLVVDFLVFIGCFGGDCRRFLNFFVEVGLVSASKDIDEWLRLVKLLDAQFSIAFCQVHTFS